jgi:RsiW-degrading membrane proteinase PrsW (M82 family)
MIDPQLIIGATLIPFFIAYLIYVKDKYIKGDGANVLLSFLLGCFIVIPVLIIQLFFDKYLAKNEFSENYIQYGLIEESFKFLILYQFRSKIFDNFDGIKYAVLISLGFAMIENIGYSLKGENWGVGGFEIIAIRMFTAIPGHLIFGVCMGYFFNIGIVKEKQKLHFNPFIPLALICPVILHGSYDYFISTNILAGILTLLISFFLLYYPLKEFIIRN